MSWILCWTTYLSPYRFLLEKYYVILGQHLTRLAQLIQYLWQLRLFMIRLRWIIVHKTFSVLYAHFGLDEAKLERVMFKALKTQKISVVLQRIFANREGERGTSTGATGGASDRIVDSRTINSATKLFVWNNTKKKDTTLKHEKGILIFPRIIWKCSRIFDIDT